MVSELRDSLLKRDDQVRLLGLVRSVVVRLNRADALCSCHVELLNQKLGATSNAGVMCLISCL